MLLVFPVSVVDAQLALDVSEWMRSLGPYSRHKALMAWSSELPVDKRAAIAAHFKAMDWAEPPRAFSVGVKDSEQKWPTAANVIFRECAKMVAQFPQFRCPWFFFEPDCTPMVPGWLDKLADTYNEDITRPFLGRVQDTFNLVGGERVKVGQHMVGTAIYPPVLEPYTKAHLHPAFAFDHAISRDIAPHWRDTRLIQHNWSTGNYRRTPEGRIVCDKVRLRFSQQGQQLDRYVAPETLVLHGCKDGSLIKLLKQKVCHVVPEVVKEQSEPTVPAYKSIFAPKTRGRYGRSFLKNRKPKNKEWRKRVATKSPTA